MAQSVISEHQIGLTGKLIGALLSLLLFFCVTEFALYIVDANFEHKNQFFPVNRDIDFAGVYKKDPNLFWKFRADKVISSEQFSFLDYRINKEARRGPVAAKEKPALRVIALGNSCTFGWGVPYDRTWTNRLQEILRTSIGIQEAEVINAGVPGYSSHQGKVWLETELLDLNPDIVVICFGWNDHWVAGQGISDDEQEVPSSLILNLHNIVSPLKTYQLIRKVVLSLTEEEKVVRLDNIASKRRVPLDQFHNNLRQMVRLIKKKGAEAVLLIPPVASTNNYLSGVFSPMHNLHAGYQNEMRRVADLEKVALVDIQADFDQYSDLFDDASSDPVHYNAKGHEIVARSLAQSIGMSQHAQYALKR